MVVSPVLNSVNFILLSIPRSWHFARSHDILTFTLFSSSLKQDLRNHCQPLRCS